MKDRQGFLWILSSGHVQCFDGRQVKLYKPDRLLTSIYCDESGTVWCSSTRNVFRFGNDKKGFELVPLDTTNASVVRHLAGWPDGRTIVVRQKDWLYYDSANHRFERIIDTSIEKSLLQLLSFEHAASNSWTKDSIALRHIAGRIPYMVELHSISRIITLSDSCMLLNEPRAPTLFYKLGEKKPVELRSLLKEVLPKFPLLIVKSAAAIGNNKFLLTSNHGIHQLDLSAMEMREVKLFVNGKPLENEGSADHLYIDDEGMAFMKHETGILVFHTRKPSIGLIRNFRVEQGQGFNNEVNVCYYDNLNNLWFATQAGLTRWNLGSNTFKTFFPEVSDPQFNKAMYSLVYDGRNFLAGSAAYGLYVFDPATEKFRRPVLTQNDSVVRQTLMNGSVWVIVPIDTLRFFINIGSRYFILDKRNYHIREIQLERTVGPAFTALPASNGDIWLGTFRGLYCLDSNFRIKHQTSEAFSRSRHIYALCETTDGKVLVGSRGLYEAQVQDTNLNMVPVDSFLAGKVVQVLFRDKRGYIWIGTDDALFRFDRQTRYIQAFKGDAVRVKGYKNNGVFEARDGTIFLGGFYGVNYLKPDAMPLKETPLDVFITGFTVNDDDSSFSPAANKAWSLKHNQSSIAIEFTVPYFESSVAPSYRYWLQGVDKHWIEAGNASQVRYSSLSPGDYSFRVAASVDGIHWYENKIPLQFSITIPWWQTWWFRAGLLLVAAGIGVVIYQWRKKGKQAKEVRKMIDYFAISGYEHSSVDDILWDIARNCISRLNFEDCVIYTIDEERGVLMQKAAYGPKSPKAFEIFNPIEIPIGKGIVGSVAQTGKPEIVPDTSRDPRYIIDDRARLSEITVPIIHEGNVIGIIDSEHRRQNFFKPWHVQVLQTIAGLCSAKISRGMALDAMRKSQLQLMELNMKMAESKLLNLRLQMNPHFLFNSLSSIQHLVVSQQTTRAYRYLTVFSNLLRNLLQYAEANFISLEKEMTMLRMYLDLETLRFDDSFSYTIEVDESLTQEDVLLPSLMVQPFAENAIWHGLMPREDDKKLDIRFNNHHDEYLTCIIEDNGIGRKEAAAIRQKKISSRVHESKGIRIIEERLSLLQRKTGKPARVDIIDKYDDAGGAAGTKVVIVIPFYNKEEV